VGAAPDLPPRPREAWHREAACRGTDPRVFYPAGRPGAPVSIAEAAEYCRACPVVAECAEAGEREQDGIWGGVLRSRRKGRPRTSRTQVRPDPPEAL